MGQITAKVYQVSCDYNFVLNGGAIGLSHMGISVPAGNCIIGVYYKIITPLATAAVNIDAGYGLFSGVGMVNPAHTVAVLNASQAWFENTLWGRVQVAVTNTGDTGIYFNTPALITSGRMIFSFTVMQNPI